LLPATTLPSSNTAQNMCPLPQMLGQKCMAPHILAPHILGPKCGPGTKCDPSTSCSPGQYTHWSDPTDCTSLTPYPTLLPGRQAAKVSPQAPGDYQCIRPQANSWGRIADVGHPNRGACACNSSQAFNSIHGSTPHTQRLTQNSSQSNHTYTKCTPPHYAISLIHSMCRTQPGTPPPKYTHLTRQ
jgi:hypothetical protein